MRRLAAGTEDASLRAQLHGLATVVGLLPTQQRNDPRREQLGRALAEALEQDDEPAVLAAAAQLAAWDRSIAQTVDWSAVSGG